MLNILRDIKKYVLVKRILSFYLLLLVLISLFLVANNMYIRSKVIKEYNNSNQQLLKEINKDFSGKLQFYKMKMIRFVLDDQVMNSVYSIQSNNDAINHYRMLMRKLTSMKTEYIGNCYLLLINQERIISSTSVGSYETFKDQYDLSVDVIINNATREQRSLFTLAKNNVEDKEIFFMSYRFRDTIIVMEVDKEGLNHYLTLTTSNLMGSHIVVTSNKDLILSTLSNRRNEKIKINVNDKATLADREYDYLKVDGGFHLTYYMLYDKVYLGYIFSSTNQYTFFLMVGFLILIGVGAFIAFSLLRPIKDLFNVIEMEDSSGQNELDVIGDVLKNIKIHQENIQVELNKYYKLNENMLLANNIFNNQNKQQYYIRTKYYFLIYVIAEKQGNMNIDFIKSLEDEVLSNHLYHKIIHYMKPQLYVIEGADSNELLKEIQDYMDNDIYKEGFYILSLSSVKSDISKIREDYEEVLQNVNWMRYSAERNIYVVDEVSQDSNNPRFSIQDESNFVKHIFHGNEKEVLQFFSSLQQNVDNAKYIGVRALYKYLLNIAYIIVSNNKELAKLYPLDMEKMNMVNSLNFFYNYLLEIFINITLYFDNKDEDIISKVECYIQDNYKSSTLDITAIAEAVGLSPNYLANYYKKETNFTLKKVIDRIRIKEAQKLLINNKRAKIEDIAHRVGITNMVTFNRVFKKYVGMTPSQYRKN